MGRGGGGNGGAVLGGRLLYVSLIGLTRRVGEVRSKHSHTKGT